ncbi:hypothetical protein [Kutzneria buriramensis]|uniref:Uncharacterized protein n=1 Tax=Kutzneria buriramensis TaxID=1045776 RepID=A0A3E0HM69_9PSEU|nr:hypothetical protein [Kutzneria buriramensis]REH47316.1 hypothetical protein BCF44_106481 [Kutzneria buriramensis]
MPAQEDAQREAARRRGAQVLLDLAVRAGLTDQEGRTGLAEISRRSVEASPSPDGGITGQTVRNLLSGSNEARTQSVELFIAACLLRQQDNPQLASEIGSASYWRARFNDALGRAGSTTAGMVRVGRPPRLADAFVQRPDLGLIAAAVVAGQSAVLTQAGPENGEIRAPQTQERVLSGLGA